MELIEMGPHDWAFSEFSRSNSAEEAFEKAFELLNFDGYELAESAFKNIILENLDDIDAYHHLAMLYEATDRQVEAYLCSKEAVNIGLNAIPKKFDWKKSKLDWHILENRPFLRAYHSLGLRYERMEKPELAIEIYSRMVSVCPNDNIGVRLLLPRLLFETGDYLSVVRLCKDYEDDASPEISYSYPLALALMGESSKAKKLFEEAEKYTPLVAKELRKKRHPKPKDSSPGYITLGGHDEAYAYWQEYGSLWSESKEAQVLLAK